MPLYNPGGTFQTLTLSGQSLTGSEAQSLCTLSTTWNTSGTPTALKLDVTDTASNVSSLLLDLRVGGSSRFSIAKSGRVTIGNNEALYMGNGGGLVLGTTPDTVLLRDAANTLAQRNGANAQAFRVYNKYTDASNYGRLTTLFSSNDCFIRTEQLGSGPASPLFIGTEGNVNLTFRSNGTNRWAVVSSGHFLASADNAYDIGTSGAQRPRDVYIARNFSAFGGCGFGISPDATAFGNFAAATTSVSSFRIQAGVAPTTPVNGDVWFDGTDLKMRVGGVTKTFTLV